MILKTKLIITGTVVSVAAIAVGLGIGLGIQPSEKEDPLSIKSDSVIAVNSAKDALDIKLSGSDEYVPVFGTAMTYANINVNGEAITNFSLDFSRLFSDDASIVDLGLAFRVIVPRNVITYDPTGAAEVDRSNPVYVQNSLVDAFKIAYPEAVEEKDNVSSLGYKVFSLPIVLKNGQLSRQFTIVKTNMYIDPETGIATELTDALIKSGTFDKNIKRSITYLILKLMKVADLTNTRVQIRSVATDEGQVLTKALFEFSKYLKASPSAAQVYSTLLTTTRGQAVDAFKRMFSIENGLLSFQSLEDLTTHLTKEEYDALSAQMKASATVSIIDPISGQATFTRPEANSSETIELDPAEVASKKYYAVIGSNYIKSVPNPLLLSSVELSELDAKFVNFADSFRNLYAQHDSNVRTNSNGDTVKELLYTAQLPAGAINPSVFNLSTRKYRSWDSSNLPSGYVSIADQATSEKKTVTQVIRDNREAKGFRYPKAIYGLETGMPSGLYKGATAANESIPDLVARALRRTALNASKPTSAIDATILGRASGAFKSIPTNYESLWSPYDSVPRDRFDITNAVVHSIGDYTDPGASASKDYSAYYKFAANYMGVNGELLQKTYTKADWKTAIFGAAAAATVTDADLLQFVLLEAKIFDSGYKRDSLDTITNAVSERTLFVRGGMRIALPASELITKEKLLSDLITANKVSMGSGFIEIKDDAVGVLRRLFGAESDQFYTERTTGMSTSDADIFRANVFVLADLEGNDIATPKTNPFKFTATDFSAALAKAETDYAKLKAALFDPVVPAVRNDSAQAFAAGSVALNDNLARAYRNFISADFDFDAVVDQTKVAYPNDPSKQVFERQNNGNFNEFSGTPEQLAKYNLTNADRPLRVPRIQANKATSTSALIPSAPTLRYVLNGLVNGEEVITTSYTRNASTGAITARDYKSIWVNYAQLNFNARLGSASATRSVSNTFVMNDKFISAADAAKPNIDLYEPLYNMFEFFAILDYLKLQVRLNITEIAADDTTPLSDVMKNLTDLLGDGKYEVLSISRNQNTHKVTALVSLIMGNYVDVITRLSKNVYPASVTPPDFDAAAARIKTAVNNYMKNDLKA